MRTSLLIFLGICLCQASSGCQPRKDKPDQTPSQHRGEGRIYVEDAGFSIIPPDGWVRMEMKNENGTFLNVFGPAQDGARPNLNVIAADRSDTPLEEIAIQIKQAKAKQNKFKQWKCLDEALVTINSKKAYLMASQHQHTVGENVIDVRNVQYLIQGHKKAYILTYSAPPTIFDSLRKKFEQSALTVVVD